MRTLTTAKVMCRFYPDVAMWKNGVNERTHSYFPYLYIFTANMHSLLWGKSYALFLLYTNFRNWTSALHALHCSRLLGGGWVSWFCTASRGFQSFSSYFIKENPKEYCPSSSSQWSVMPHSIIIYSLMQCPVEVNDTVVGKSHCVM